VPRGVSDSRGVQSTAELWLFCTRAVHSSLASNVRAIYGPDYFRGVCSCGAHTMTDFAAAGATLRPNPEVICRHLDQGAVLVDVPANRIFELNLTGATVWELLGQGFNVERIVSQLVQEFEVESACARDEVNSLVVRLRAEGLITS
jgi:hypothetical protein